MLFNIRARKFTSPGWMQFTFDNMTCQITDAQGQKIDFSKSLSSELNDRLAYHESALAFSAADIQFQRDHIASLTDHTEVNDFKPYSPANPLKGKSRDVSKLRIQLGLACNYRCAYCLQSQDRQSLETMPKAEDVYAFFDKFDGASLRLQAHGLVDFWGGEPLVYWPVLKVLIPEMRRRWGDSPQLSLFTNGVLLDDAKIDFLNDHRVRVNISHDAQGFSLRHPEDPLDDPKIRKTWLRLWETSAQIGLPMAFFAVINPLNCDLFAMRDFFEERFAKGVRFSFGGAASESADLPQSCLLSPDNARVLELSMIRAMVTDRGNWPGLERRVFNMMGRMVHQTPSSRIRYHCNAVDEHVLSVTLKGDVLSCQNRPAGRYTIGKLDAFDEITNALFTHWSLRPDCRNCLVLPACKGGCPDLSDNAQRRCCNNDYAFHYAVFSSAWLLLTGTHIESVTPGPSFRRKTIPIAAQV